MMKRLFAPWRNKYVTRETRPQEKRDNVCPFCDQLSDNDDEKHFILKRFNHCFVILNRYPYNEGHLLIIPLQHKAKLSELSPEARQEIMSVVSTSVDLLEGALNNQGTNVGINIGPASGASIPTHLHIHLLPRWKDDTNFMPVIADTKILSSNLQQAYDKLKPLFEKLPN